MGGWMSASQPANNGVGGAGCLTTRTRTMRMMPFAMICFKTQNNSAVPSGRLQADTYYLAAKKSAEKKHKNIPSRKFKPIMSVAWWADILFGFIFEVIARAMSKRKYRCVAQMMTLMMTTSCKGVAATNVGVDLYKQRRNHSWARYVVLKQNIFILHSYNKLICKINENICFLHVCMYVDLNGNNA